MKNIVFSAAAAALLFSAAPAFAIDGGTPRQPLTSIDAVLKSGVDDYPVVVTGTIVKNIGDEKYEFRDDTGTMQAEIDKEDLYNITVEGARVTLTGEIDIEGKIIEIDADTVAKAE